MDISYIIICLYIFLYEKFFTGMLIILFFITSFTSIYVNMYNNFLKIIQALVIEFSCCNTVAKFVLI